MSEPTSTVDIVISGCSGRFPESNNVSEFEYNLYNGIDMVSSCERRYPSGIYGLPNRAGLLPDLVHFDAAFFGVPHVQAMNMDPQMRLLLETTYECFIDAGINPAEMRGTRTGVYVGGDMSELMGKSQQELEASNGYLLFGCTPNMFANRLSYCFDLRGPSLVTDTGCSSAITALALAFTDLKVGNCDAAIVAGTRICELPESAVYFNKMGMLAPDGTCKSFDNSGNGYVRSECIATILLQKRSDARRIYAHVVNVQCNADGYKASGITFPSTAQQAALLREIYSKACVNPVEVAYLEAHGTGTKAGDPQEAMAIDEVLCEHRRPDQLPLLIGSVKASMGHSEPAAAMPSIIKVLLAIHNKSLPPNIHYTSPNVYIPGLESGTLKVVTEVTPFNGKYIGINSFGFGGANGHILLRAPEEHNAQQQPQCDMRVGSLCGA